MLSVHLLAIFVTCALHLNSVHSSSTLGHHHSSNHAHTLIKRELNSQGCGLRGNDVPQTTQIIGGQSSQIPWPWQASLTSNGAHFCGGSVIDAKHIISAAHCFQGATLQPEMVQVSVGEITQGEGQKYQVAMIYLHEGYTGEGTWYNDIALLVLQDPLPAGVTPICLPESDDIADSEPLVVTGFGSMDRPDGAGSPILQEVYNIPYVETNRCNEILASLAGSTSVTENQLCTNADEGGKGACSGDSGGPVMRQLADQRWSLVGVVSYYTVSCAHPGVPFMNTRVFPYIDWIRQHMQP